VVVVGGGDTAVGEALFLTGLCRQVTLVHSRDKLRAIKILQERAFATANLSFAWSSKVLEVLGETKVKGVRLQDVNTATERVIDTSGVFIFVGLKPQTDFLQRLIDVDRGGFIITDENMKTSLEGVFACGDCRQKKLRQIVTACAEGAIAASMALEFVEEVKGN
jgi:thioredoxin reductase (NADPH)